MINELKLKEFTKYLKKNHSKLRPWASKNGIECYRIYNRNVAGLPFVLDIYKNCLHAACFEDSTEISEEDLETILSSAGKTLYIKDDGIFYKYREKLTEGTQYKKYAAEKKELIVSENDLSFIVNLTDYLDTGLFLDHRNTRAMVMQNSINAKVLNLFAYTGSFSVYAAAGYAQSTTTVDMSNTYISWAQKNMQLNNFTGKNHKYVTADVLSFISDAIEAGNENWDLIILDPPTFSNSRKMSGKFDVQKDHVKLIQDCSRLLTKNGTLLFSTNFKKFSIDRAKLGNLILRDITNETIPNDYLGSKIHKCWTIMKRPG